MISKTFGNEFFDSFPSQLFRFLEEPKAIQNNQKFSQGYTNRPIKTY
jgi:hypothetical protein